MTYHQPGGEGRLAAAALALMSAAILGKLALSQVLGTDPFPDVDVNAQPVEIREPTQTGESTPTPGPPEDHQDHRTEVGVFVWPRSINHHSIQGLKRYDKVAVLVRGTSGITNTEPLKLVRNSVDNTQVYAWITGFERADGGWDRPWDPRVRREILNAVKAALPYCDGIILDDSFRYPRRDPKAERAITTLIQEIAQLAHEHGKKVYYCILPEDMSKYSVNIHTIAQHVDTIIVEAYTQEYHQSPDWVLHIYHLNANHFGPNKIAIALHDHPRKIAQELHALKRAGCPEVWIFRYGEVGVLPP